MKLYLGDCLNLMNNIQDKSIDCIICDLPYGTTACKWDVIIPFDDLWKCYNRIIKDNGAIALFGSEPFSSLLRTSNFKNYRYDWIWDKGRGTGFQIVKYKPMCCHENISIFYKTAPTYNPQMRDRDKPRLSINKGTTRQFVCSNGNEYIGKAPLVKKYPITIVYCPNNNQAQKLHPTQKPVELIEYLIKTYSNEGDLILDNCMGSGTTGVACIRTNRDFIGIELDENYFNIASNRIKNELQKGRLF